MAFAPVMTPILGANQGVFYYDSGTVTGTLSVGSTTDTVISGVLPTEVASEVFKMRSPSGAGWAFEDAKKEVV